MSAHKHGDNGRVNGRDENRRVWFGVRLHHRAARLTGQSDAFFTCKLPAVNHGGNLAWFFAGAAKAMPFPVWRFGENNAGIAAQKARRIWPTRQRQSEGKQNQQEHGRGTLHYWHDTTGVA